MSAHAGIANHNTDITFLSVHLWSIQNRKICCWSGLSKWV